MSEQQKEISRGGCLRIQGIVLAVLVLWVLLVEGGLRVVDVPGFTRDELDPISMKLADARVEGHPYLAYANKPLYQFEGQDHSISHNSLGFRGPETTWEKPEGVYRIVCLGGSSTYGHGPSSNATTYPARLEKRLNESLGAGRVEVINGGCQGYSAFESVVNLSFRMIDFQPDLVVVYHSINDVRCALYPNAVRDNTHWRAVFPSERVPEIQRVLERSTTFLIWRRYFTDYVAERQNLGAYMVVDFNKYDDFYAQPEPTGRGFVSFQRNLVTLIEVARSHGAEAMLVTQGMDGSDLDGAGSQQLQLDGMVRAREILLAVAAERNAPLVDAEAVLEAEAKTQLDRAGSESIFTHEVHLTDEGADLLARTIAEKVLDLGLVR